MVFGQVRIPLYHLQRLMAEHFGDFQLAGTVHGQVAGRTVAQVMEAEIDNTGTSAGIFPGFTNIDRLKAVSSRKKKIGSLG